jgi:hypothetical protein
VSARSGSQTRRRPHLIGLRVDDEELAVLQRVAAESGMGLATLARSIVMPRVRQLDGLAQQQDALAANS